MESANMNGLKLCVEQERSVEQQWPSSLSQLNRIVYTKTSDISMDIKGCKMGWIESVHYNAVIVCATSCTRQPARQPASQPANQWVHESAYWYRATCKLAFSLTNVIVCVYALPSFFPRSWMDDSIWMNVIQHCGGLFRHSFDLF